MTSGKLVGSTAAAFLMAWASAAGASTITGYYTLNGSGPVALVDSLPAADAFASTFTAGGFVVNIAGGIGMPSAAPDLFDTNLIDSHSGVGVTDHLVVYLLSAGNTAPLGTQTFTTSFTQNSNNVSGSLSSYADLTQIGSANFPPSLSNFIVNGTATVAPGYQLSAVYDITATGSSGSNATINISQVPGPIVGAGLPGLIAACGGLLALARRRRKELP